MKKLRFILLGATAFALAPLSLLRAGDGYAGANSATGTWNDATPAVQWTSDSGATYVEPTVGNVYHTNGFNVRAGQVGVPSDLGAAGSITFAGDQLIVDSFNAASGVTSNLTLSKLIFEQADPASNVQASGPRQTPASYYRAVYTANIVTAPTTGSDVRTLQGSTGLITLKGTLTLNGATNLFIPSKVTDMRFNIEAALSGSGNIAISGGSAGGTTANGFVTWAFGDLSNWHGTHLTVLNKHTIAFTQNSDFYSNNPALALDFPSTSIGFINLSANVSFASGKVTITTGTGAAPVTRTLPDGVYTTTDLNTWAASLSGAGTYGAQTWASEGDTYSPTGTTYKLYVGQALPATAPTISTQPVGQTVFAGTSVSFSVSASGTPAPTYQWQKDGTPLTGQTAASLSLSDVTPSDSGVYTVVVTNAGGSVTSDAAILIVQTVSVPPSFTTQPQDKTSYAGTTVTFTASAIGTPAPTYQWKLNGTDIAGATTTTLTRTNISDLSAGVYTCVATNSVGSTTSTGATLIVTPLPTGMHAYANASAGSSDNWNGAKAAAQWTFDSGANYLTASPGNTYHTNGYQIRAGHAGTVAPAAPGVSTFNGATLVIDAFDAASHLTDNSAAGGGLLNFEPATTGAGPRLAPTATTRAAFTANIVIAATSPTDQPRTIRTNTGSATLDGTLVLNGKTVFSIPGSVNDVLFEVNSPVTGSGSMELSGGSSSSATANGFVTWAFHDLTGWTGASLAVMHHHTISFAGPTDFFRTNPAAAVVFGSEASPSTGYLNIQADVSFGSGKLSFITGNSSKPVTNIVPDGVYTVASLNAYVANVVAGTSGGYVDLPLASEGATNTTTPNYSGTTYRIYVGSGPANQTAPIITTQPQGTSVLLGATVTLTVVVDGQPTPTLQWQKDGVAITGATNATLTLANAQLSDSGTYTVVATNTVSSVTSTGAVVTVNLPPAPQITTQPVSATRNAGTTVTFSVALAANAATPAFQWQKNGSAVTGATAANLTLANVQAADAATYTVVVTNIGGSVTSDAATLVVTPVVPTPAPIDPVTVALGKPITLTAAAQGTEPFTYVWMKDGAVIPGATESTYTIASAQASDSGIYTYIVTNSVGSATSADAEVIVSTVSPTYLSNLSVRAQMSPDQTLIMGFVVADGAKPVLVRAAGPMLNTFDISGVPNPSVVLNDLRADPASVVASNDDWDASLAAEFSRLGATPFVEGSTDAALLHTISGPHTAHAVSGGTGIILVEAYDAGLNDGPKLTNGSARFHAGTGDDILIMGFVIAGTGKQWVLVRALGPTLVGQGVTEVLVDPQFEIYQRVNDVDVFVASNDNWDASLAAEFSRLGAYPLPAGSKDAALLIQLDAGIYTVQVSGVANGTGEALVEIYDAAP